MPQQDPLRHRLPVSGCWPSVWCWPPHPGGQRDQPRRGPRTPGGSGSAPTQTSLAAYTREASRPPGCPPRSWTRRSTSTRSRRPPASRTPAWTWSARRWPAARPVCCPTRRSPACLSRSWGAAPSASPGRPAPMSPEDDITLQVHPDRRGVVGLDADRLRPRARARPASEEARHARPGTDALLVGDVDLVRSGRRRRERSLPADLRLAVVDPAGRRGRRWRSLRWTRRPWTAPRVMRRCRPARPPAWPPIPARAPTVGPDRPAGGHVHPGSPDLLPVPSGARTSGCVRRASLHYGEVHGLRPPHRERERLHPRGGAALLRSIYAYHTQSRDLVRHRLQLPRRPVRPDLGGPVLSAASTGRSWARTR